MVGGFAKAAADGHVYNSAALVDGTGVLAVYRKLHLWDAEKEVFEPGGAPAGGGDAPRADRAGRLLRPRVPRADALSRLRGADILCVPTNWPREEREDDERAMLATLTIATARLSKVFFALCDRYGTERGAAFEGGSVIADE